MNFFVEMLIGLLFVIISYLLFIVILELYYNYKLNKLLQSDRYLKSNVVIRQVNNKYAIYICTIDQYADLDNKVVTYRINSTGFKDCIGNKSKVIQAFNDRFPIIKVIK